jgi:hypothetical protein
VGASGGISTAWNGALFKGELAFQNDFSLSLKFMSKLSQDDWILTNVYGPCTADRKIEFLDWFKNIDMPDSIDWIIMGDFNFIKSPSNRNTEGGDVNDMLAFNEAISNLGLVELPLKGRKFTWSNMQQVPLLEKLDWFFTSSSWTLNYPSTLEFPPVKPTLDHLPSVVAIGTKIPRAKIFIFENYWLQHSSFKEIEKNAWKIPLGYSCSAKRVYAKFKNLRRPISLWEKNRPCLKKQIDQVNSVIELLDIVEETRPLNSYEWNMRDFLKSHIITLLRNQKSY